jgi:PKD repeat protein
VAGSCTSVTVTFSSAGLSPADYSGALLVLSNDPDESWLSVPVSLTVLAPLSGVNFGWSPPDPVIGQTVLFSATVAAGEPSIDYSWNWGDGTTGSGQYAAHTFAAPATYTVTLTAINACGQAVVQHQVAVAGLPDIDVTAPPLETVLCPDATDASVVTICNAGTALLTWSLSENPAVDWLSENPDSGSLLPAGCVDVDVTFDAAGLAPGDYSADLLVISNDPDEPQLALPASLAVLTPVGDLSLQFSPPDPVVGETIYFTGTVTAGDPPLTYAWTWGDGTAPGSGQYATHAYATAGDYLVVLTVSNACGPAQAEWTVTARQGGLYVVYLPVVARSYP